MNGPFGLGSLPRCNSSASLDGPVGAGNFSTTPLIGYSSVLVDGFSADTSDVSDAAGSDGFLVSLDGLLGRLGSLGPAPGHICTIGSIWAHLMLTTWRAKICTRLLTHSSAAHGPIT